MRNKNIIPKQKKCPLMDQNCLKEGCALYNELLTNCVFPTNTLVQFVPLE